MLKILVVASSFLVSAVALGCGGKCDKKAGDCPRHCPASDTKEMCKGDAKMCKEERGNAGAKACHEEARKLCGAKTPEEIHACLPKNTEKLSALCKEHLKGEGHGGHGAHGEHSGH
jgi:hypothetical protein